MELRDENGTTSLLVDQYGMGIQSGVGEDVMAFARSTGSLVTRQQSTAQAIDGNSFRGAPAGYEGPGSRWRGPGQGPTRCDFFINNDLPIPSACIPAPPAPPRPPAPPPAPAPEWTSDNANAIFDQFVLWKAANSPGCPSPEPGAPAYCEEATSPQFSAFVNAGGVAIPSSSITSYFEAADTDNSGRMTRTEFIAADPTVIFAPPPPAPPQWDRVYANQIFDDFLTWKTDNVDGCPGPTCPGAGTATQDQFVAFVQGRDPSITTEAINTYFAATDTNNSGTVEREEFRSGEDPSTMSSASSSSASPGGDGPGGDGPGRR